MDTAEAITTFETVMRDMIRAVIGDQWQSVAGISLTRLQKTRDREAARRVGVLTTGDLLNYTDLSELRKIIDARWSDFEPALGGMTRESFTAHFNSIEGFRNTTAHSRTLQPFEEQLVHGATGLFRNLASIHRSAKGPDMQYYPTIDSAEDSFGRDKVSGNSNGNKPRLQVGQIVTFRCKGTDPQGRELSWEMRPNNEPHSGYAQTGEEVEFEWEAKDHQVRDSYYVVLRLIASSKYHRHGSFDEEVFFFYAIDPPVE